MRKLSSEQISQVLSEAPGVIRALVHENETLRAKVASMVQRDQAEKLAEAMHTKGLELDTRHEDLVDRLEKAAMQGKLETIQAAVDLVGPDMGSKLASIANHDGKYSATGTELERFIVGGVG